MENNWINETVFYHIYPLGFTKAPKYNEGEKTAGNRIQKVLEWIPHLKESRYKEWFYHLDFTQQSPAGDKFSYEMWEGNGDLVKLNLKNPEVYHHLLGAVKMWIEELWIDGLRLDAADCVDKDFFRMIRKFTKEIKEDFWLMGEIIHGDYNEWANNEMLDSVTNYECWKGEIFYGYV